MESITVTPEKNSSEWHCVFVVCMLAKGSVIPVFLHDPFPFT